MKKHMNKFNRKPKYRLYKLLMREYIQCIYDLDDISCHSMLSDV